MAKSLTAYRRKQLADAEVMAAYDRIEGALFWLKGYPSQSGYYWAWNGRNGSKAELAEIAVDGFRYVAHDIWYPMREFPRYFAGLLVPPATT